MIYREVLEYDTKMNNYIDITSDIKLVVSRSKIEEGICNIFMQGTTAGLMMNENDMMLMSDFKKFLQIIDEKKLYNHPENAFSHMKANLIGFDKSVPISHNELVLGKWQEIMLWEFDTKPRKRKIVVTIMGE